MRGRGHGRDIARRTRGGICAQLTPAAVMADLRERFAAADALVRDLAARRRFDAIADLAEAYPLSVFPDAVGLRKEGREHLLPYAVRRPPTRENVGHPTRPAARGGSDLVSRLRNASGSGLSGPSGLARKPLISSDFNRFRGQ